MKYLWQVLWILLFTFAGEVLEALIPLSIPAGIYGLVLLFAALWTKLLPLETVKDVSKYLISIMTILFLPATVGLMETWSVLQPIWLPFLVSCLVSTVLVMLAAGWVAQLVQRLSRRKGAEK